MQKTRCHGATAYRKQIPIYKPSDRIGSAIITIDPAKIVGVVETDLEDEARGFSETSPLTESIGHNVAEFLAAQLAAGMIPKPFLPIQSGVGDIANSVLGALGSHPGIPPFEMYTEVLQDSVVSLIEHGRITFASSCSFTVTPAALQRVYDNLKFFRSRVVLRPQEISNSPEIIRRLGITCPSVAKGGKISTIVPLASHVDHSEHSVQIIATEYGVADLRGKSPFQRANEIIDRCAHPEFRDLLRSYLTIVEGGHTPHTLSAAFRIHEHFQKTGDMHGCSWDEKQ